MMLFGYDICDQPASEIIAQAMASGEPSMINALNPHSYVVAKTDPTFRRALKQSTVLLPDGSGIVFAARFVNGQAIRKVTGMDFFLATMAYLQKHAGTVLFFGSTEQVLGKIIRRTEREFPAVKVRTFSPPYKSGFSGADLERFRFVIRDSMADVVFFGLTAPKQEKLGLAIGPVDGVKVMSGIGAVFDFYAGTVKRPSEFWIRIHLEWLVRLLGEPRRLWRRNLVSTPVFLLDCLLARLRNR